jgi:hypothetical protein
VHFEPENEKGNILLQFLCLLRKEFATFSRGKK